VTSRYTGTRGLFCGDRFDSSKTFSSVNGTFSESHLQCSEPRRKWRDCAPLGAFLVTFPGARIRSLLIIFIFVRVTFIPAALLIGIWFVMQVFSAGAVANVQTGGVAYMAHVGGDVWVILRYGCFGIPAESQWNSVTIQTGSIIRPFYETLSRCVLYADVIFAEHNYQLGLWHGGGAHSKPFSAT
jgi:hypothetical protein